MSLHGISKSLTVNRTRFKKCLEGSIADKIRPIVPGQQRKQQSGNCRNLMSEDNH